MHHGQSRRMHAWVRLFLQDARRAQNGARAPRHHRVCSFSTVYAMRCRSGGMNTWLMRKSTHRVPPQQPTQDALQLRPLAHPLVEGDLWHR